MAAALARRSRAMDGSATLTTKKSRTKMKVPLSTIASGAHLAKRETGPASALACWVMVVMTRLSGLPLQESQAPETTRGVTGETSADPARHVRLRALVVRILEDLLGRAVLDEHTGAGVAVGVDEHGEERRAVADPGGLLHVVRDDHDR